MSESGRVPLRQRPWIPYVAAIVIVVCAYFLIRAWGTYHMRAWGATIVALMAFGVFVLTTWFRERRQRTDDA